MDSSQLNIFDQPIPDKSISTQAKTEDPSNAFAADDNSASSVRFAPGESYAPGVRIRITQAGPPIEHLNGRLGEIISVNPGVASVQIEGIAVNIMLQVEALETYSDITHYLDEEAPLIEVGSCVECDYAFVGKAGAVRRIEKYCGALVAWVDFGPGKPLYPAAVESLSLA